METGSAASSDPVEIDPEHPAKSLIAALKDVASDREKVTIGQLFEVFGSTSFTAALAVPAILVVSPLSGVPLFSSFIGLSIALISAQMIVGRDSLWLPGALARRKVDAERLLRDLSRSERYLRWVDRVTRPRLRLLSTGPARLLKRVACLLCGLAMPFLEIVPFSSSILGAAVLCFAVSLLARDGLFVLGGLIFMVVAVVVPFTVASSVVSAVAG